MSAISKLPGGILCFTSKVSCTENILNLTIISAKKLVTPLERAHETQGNDIFPDSLGCISKE